MTKSQNMDDELWARVNAAMEAGDWDEGQAIAILLAEIDALRRGPGDWRYTDIYRETRARIERGHNG